MVDNVSRSGWGAFGWGKKLKAPVKGLTIRFKRTNDNVNVEASYAEAVGECSFDAFSREVDRFRHAVFQAAKDRYPSLGNNVAYKLLETAGQ